MTPSREERAAREVVNDESEQRLLAVLGQFGPQTFGRLARKALPNVSPREADNRVRALAKKGQVETKSLVPGGHPHWHITDDGRRRIHLPTRSAAAPLPESPRASA